MKTYKAIKLPGEAVRVNGVLVWPCALVDETTPTKSDYIFIDGDIIQASKIDLEAFIDHAFKVICTIGVKLEGVEMAVEKVSNYGTRQKIKIHKDHLNKTKVTYSDREKQILFLGISLGYNSREGYTREDMDAAIKIAREGKIVQVSDEDVEITGNYTSDQIIEKFSLPREISEVELSESLEIIKIKYK